MNVEKSLSVDYILKRVNKRYKTSLTTILSFFGLEKNEIELYRALAKKHLKIKELSAKLHLSERTVRRHIKFMLEGGFIKRRVVGGKRLAYEYMPSPLVDMWKNVKTEIKRNINFIDQTLTAESAGNKGLREATID